jgi:Protein of unknown function (DUF3501)
MRPLAVEEVRPPALYEPVRPEALRRDLELRAPRMVALGDLLTVLFENRRTVATALEEQLRAGQVEEPERIAGEVATFNALIPGERELSATVYCEIDDAAALGRRLRELPGVTGAVHVEVDGARAERVEASLHGFPTGSEPVQHLRFRLTEEQCAAVERGAEVVVCCDHPAHRVRTVLGEEQRRALAEDLER